MDVMYDHDNELVQKWEPVLEGIDHDYTRRVTAQLLENQAKSIVEEKLQMNEAITGATTTTGQLSKSLPSHLSVEFILHLLLTILSVFNLCRDLFRRYSTLATAVQEKVEPLPLMFRTFTVSSTLPTAIL